MPTLKAERSKLELMAERRRASAQTWCCSQAYAYNVDTPTEYVRGAKRIRCDSWFCDYCRPKKIKALTTRTAQLFEGVPTYLITLTTRDRRQSRQRALIEIEHAFSVLIKRIRRKVQGFIYVKVIELHKNGLPHLHIIGNRYLSQRWVKNNWCQIWGAYVCDVRPCDAGRVAGYVCKYLAKSWESAPQYHAVFSLCKRRRFSNSILPGGAHWHNPAFFVDGVGTADTILAHLETLIGQTAWNLRIAWKVTISNEIERCYSSPVLQS